MNEEDIIQSAVPSFDGDAEPFLPDGWDGKSDIFEGLVDEDAVVEGADELRVDAGLDELFNEGEEETITEEPEDAASPEQGAPTTEPEPASLESAPVSQRTLKLKVNHQEREVDVNAMSDEEIVALFQKGYAFDEVKNEERKATYDRVYQEELDLGMSERQAKYAAEREAGGDFSAPDEVEEETPAPESPAPPPTGRDVSEEIRQLRILRPNVKSIPDDVTKMIAQGINVTQAYLAWEADTTRKAAASLKRENEILKQNAASAARAPVTGVTGGGATTEKAQSSFDKALQHGFDSGAAW